MRVKGIVRLAQIVALSAAAFALTGCVYHYDDGGRGGRHHRGDVSQGYGGGPSAYHGGYYGRDHAKGPVYPKAPRYDRHDSRSAYDGDHTRKRYDSDRHEYRDRGYGAHRGYGNHHGYGNHRGSVCDSDGDRCYGSAQPYWNYREYYRRHGYRWQND